MFRAPHIQVQCGNQEEIMVLFRDEFEEGCKKVFESDSKIGLLCSIASDGYPHISLISSINIKDSTTMMWGQFSRGLIIFSHCVAPPLDSIIPPNLPRKEAGGLILVPEPCPAFAAVYLPGDVQC